MYIAIKTNYNGCSGSWSRYEGIESFLVWFLDNCFVDLSEWKQVEVLDSK